MTFIFFCVRSKIEFGIFAALWLQKKKVLISLIFLFLIYLSTKKYPNSLIHSTTNYHIPSILSHQSHKGRYVFNCPQKYYWGELVRGEGVSGKSNLFVALKPQKMESKHGDEDFVVIQFGESFTGFHGWEKYFHSELGNWSLVSSSGGFIIWFHRMKV